MIRAANTRALHYSPRRSALSMARARWRRAARNALVVAVVALLASCGPVGEQSRHVAPRAKPSAAQAATFPMAVSDDAGRQVLVKAEPTRIVSAAPSTTEILFALGLHERVTAVTTFCNYPEAARAKPKIGGLRLNLEAVVTQEPDLVLAVRGTPPDVIAGLEALDIPVIVLNPPNFGGVLSNITLVGRVTGTGIAAKRLTSDMQRRWDAVVEKTKAVTKKPRVLYEVDATDPAAVSTAGPGTFIDAMITAAGGVNVMAALTPGQQYPKVSAETVLQADPEIIILGDSPFGQSADTLARRPGWNAVAAVQRGAIVTITQNEADVLSRAGPRLVEGLELIAKAVQPELFR